ncbi:MAG: twin-arginine translocase subunit TatC [Anaerolineae bacterium]|nr:twin-arginine translocase subunit TatC [Anaerolineae bacterium]
MISDLLHQLPQIPVSTEAAVMISTLVISLAAGLIALIHNWNKLSDENEKKEEDLWSVFENLTSSMSHLHELRGRIVKIFISVVVGTVIAALITNQLIVLLTNPIGGMNKLIAISVTESFGVFFRVSLVAGLILASPFIIAQIWIFIGTGLYENERRAFYLYVPFAALLFILGVAFAYFVMLPVAIPFLVGFMGFRATPTLDNYIKFVTTALLAVGASFELPMVIYILARTGIVDSRMLIKGWRYAIVGIAVLAAVVTPTPDPVNMGIVAAPLFGLYLLSIVLAFFAQRRRKKQEDNKEIQST